MKIGITQTTTSEAINNQLSNLFKEQEFITSVLDINSKDLESLLEDFQVLIILINKEVLSSISREKWQFLIDLNQKERLQTLTIQVDESSWIYSPNADKLTTFPLDKSLLNNDNISNTVTEIINHINGNSTSNLVIASNPEDNSTSNNQQPSIINATTTFNDNNRKIQRIEKLKESISIAKTDKKWMTAIELTQELISISTDENKENYQADLVVLEKKNEAAKLIAKGRKLFQKGDFEKALVIFEKAYLLQPSEKLNKSILKIKSKQRHKKVDEKTKKGQQTKLYILLITLAFAGFVGVIVYNMNKPVPINEEIEVNETEVPDYEMVFVEGGTFSMGKKGEADQEPVHNVNLTSFYMGKYEVTVEQFDLYCKEQNIDFFNVPFGRGKLPMTKVSWINALEYANWLSRKDGFSAVYIIIDEYEVMIDENADGYRLPTECQWEFAARGGNKSNKYLYSGNHYINQVSWYSDNSGNKSHDVGTKQANELGIHDMSGNVWEWCWDWYGERAYGYHEKTNPQGMISGRYKCVRGGSWYTPDYYLQSKYRSTAMPLSKDPDLGFRLIRME